MEMPARRVFADPKVDLAFKVLFGREATRSLAICLLNAVLDLPEGQQIVELELLNPFNPQETLDDKLIILDVKVRDQTGRYYNIEMQMLPFPCFSQRILFYWSQMYQEQLQSGDSYTELRPTVSISFLNYELFQDEPRSHLRFRLLEVEGQYPLTADIDIHILQLRKFCKTAAELATLSDCWLYFLCHAETMNVDDLPLLMQRSEFQLAFETLHMLTQSGTEKQLYDARRKAQLDYNTAISESHREGLEKGVEEGLEKGIEKGIEKGRREEKAEIVRKFQRRLHQTPTSTDTLLQKTLGELERLEAELEKLLFPEG